jgi:hypothetical protein
VIYDRSAEVGAAFAEQVDPGGHRLALIVGQRRSLFDELIRDLDIPHRHTMSYHS